MPERDKYPKKYFSGNPFEGKDAFAMYKELRWGEEWREAFEIDAPEDMAVLGYVSLIVVRTGATSSKPQKVKWKKGKGPYLAIGRKSNGIYIVPREGGEPVNVPSDGYDHIGTAIRTEYWSDKGGEEALYYHDHEKPFPRIYFHEDSGCFYYKPARVGRGKTARSYAVGKEGIIG